MPQHSKLIVYYFSGTGNSATIAHWIAEIANGIKSELINIAHIDRLHISVPFDDALIAFIWDTVAATLMVKVFTLALMAKSVGK